jgi:hypothetical protein
VDEIGPRLSRPGFLQVRPYRRPASQHLIADMPSRLAAGELRNKRDNIRAEIQKPLLEYFFRHRVLLDGNWSLYT